MQKRVIKARQSDRWQFLAYKLMLRTALKLPSQQAFSLAQLRQGMEWMNDQMQRWLPPMRVKPVFLDGVRCERHESDTLSDQGRILLYVHGGAFFAGSPITHRVLASQLAHMAQMPVVVPDYRLAPEYEFPAPLMDIHTVFEALIAQGYRADQIVVAGDSAGAGLALMLAQRLKAVGQALPCCLLLISPYVDYTFSQTSHQAQSGQDPMLSVKVLKRGIEALIGSQDIQPEKISPLFGDLCGLPPLCMQVGTEEILLDDAQELAKRADQAGTEVVLEVYHGLWHDFQLFSPQLAIGRRALEQLARWARADWSTPAC